MEQNETQVIELEQLGVRVFYGAPLTEVLPEDGASVSFIHKHPFYELHIIVESECSIRADGMLYVLKPDQFLLIGAGVNHTPKQYDEQFRRICISFELMSKPRPVGRWLERSIRAHSVWVGDARDMIPTVQRIFEETENGGHFTDEYIQALLAMLILQLVRAIEPQQQSLDPVKKDLDKTRTMLIDHYFNANFQCAAGEERLAESLGVSRRQLDRILKKLYGKGFQEKVMEIRMEVACDLLQHSQKTIREISESVGYSTPSNFTAFFTNNMGITPSEYRRQMGQK